MSENPYQAPADNGSPRRSLSTDTAIIINLTLFMSGVVGGITVLSFYTDQKFYETHDWRVTAAVTSGVCAVFLLAAFSAWFFERECQ